MTASKFISASERKILLTLSLFMALSYYGNLVNYCIKTYNGRMAAEEQLKMERANDPDSEQFHFNACGSGTSLWGFLLSFQFFTNPAIFVILIYSKKFWEYFFAFSLNLTTACGFYLWADYSVRFGRDLLPDSPRSIPFGEVLLYRSTGLEQFLCFLAFALLGLQLFLWPVL